MQLELLYQLKYINDIDGFEQERLNSSASSSANTHTHLLPILWMKIKMNHNFLYLYSVQYIIKPSIYVSVMNKSECL